MPSHFTEENPRLQYAWDHSSITPFKICPRKYYYNMIAQQAPSAQAPALTFGSLYHASLEEYDKALARGESFEDAQRKAVRYALEKTGAYEEGWECPTCEAWGEGPTCTNCAGETVKTRRWVPWNSDDTRRTRFTMVRSVVWYTEQFHPNEDPLQALILPDGKPAVELSFQISLGITNPFGQDYIYCGHIDKIARLPSSGIYIQERKHTVQTISGHYFDKYSPDNQISGYIFAAEVLLGETPKGAFVDATQVAVGFSRFSRGPVHRTKAQLEEWLRDTIYHIRLAEQCAQQNNWPMNDSVCGLYGGCDYRDVCNKDPSVRDNYLKSNFKTRVWNPLEVRD